MDGAEKNNVIVGEGVTLTGEVDAPGLVRVHGTIEGSLVGDEVRVGATGRIKGSLTGRKVDLEGQVGEKVVAKTLALRATASVHGDVEYETIEIEAGARIDGSLHRAGPDSVADSEAGSSYINAEQLIERLAPEDKADEPGQDEDGHER